MESRFDTHHLSNDLPQVLLLRFSIIDDIEHRNLDPVTHRRGARDPRYVVGRSERECESFDRSSVHAVSREGEGVEGDAVSGRCEIRRVDRVLSQRLAPSVQSSPLGLDEGRERGDVQEFKLLA